MTCIPYLNQWFKLSGNMPDMSFTVTVVHRDGQTSVTALGEVPDGELTISGHEDDSLRSLSVARRGADGRYVQQANSVHHKESA